MDDPSDHNLLIRLDENVKHLLLKVDRMEANTTNRVDQLEKRIDNLESLKWQLMGAASVLAFLVSLVLQLLSRLLPKAN